MNPRRGTIAPLLSGAERDEFTWGRVILIYEVWIRSWEFETEVGSAGGGGGRVAWHKQPSVLEGLGDAATSRHPPTVTTTTTTTTLWLPACSLVRSSLWRGCSFGFWRSVETRPDRHVGINASAPPRAAADACCASAPVVRLHLCRTAGWLSAESSIKSTSIYFDSSKIKVDLDLFSRQHGNVSEGGGGCVPAYLWV